MKKMTQEEFLAKAKEVHKDENLDFSKVVYVNSDTKVTIIDNDINPKTGKPYGEYQISAYLCLKGRKHPVKGRQLGDKKRTMTKEEFVERANKVHHGMYDYKKVEYKGNHTKVCIIDHGINPKTGEEYGEFWQNPANHLAGQGNPARRGERISKSAMMTNEEFIKKAKLVHPDEDIDYSKVDYKGNKVKVCLIDRDINPFTGEEYGEFWQMPNSFLMGHGNPDKAIVRNTLKYRLTQEEFVKKAKDAHPGENLDYSKAVYKTMYDKVCIIDHDIDPFTGKEYGEYWQTPVSHIFQKAGHPVKARQKAAENRLIGRDEFIRRAEELYPDRKLDYSKVVYKGLDKAVCIIDHEINPETGLEYGMFWQKPLSHLNGCFNPNRSEKKQLTTEEFIKRAKEAHQGENLDYSKVEYINISTPVCIIDHDINPDTGEEYGEFWQTPYNHLAGCKHPARAHNQLLTTEEFIRKAKEVHKGENLDYSKVEYKGGDIPVCIIDHDINPDTGKEYGEFWQKAKYHLTGMSNPNKAINKPLNTNEFVKRAKKVHKGENLDYSKVEYINMDTPVCIIDHDIDPETGKEYGEYWQKPCNHLNGHGLKKKSIYNFSMSRIVPEEEFRKRLKDCYPDEDIDFSKMNYRNIKTPVTLGCKKHGFYNIVPEQALKHISGVCCPMCCRNGHSTKEINIYNYICELIGKDNVILGDRKILNGKELDIYIPDKKIAIEFNGLLWHSEIYSRDKLLSFKKTEECNKKGIFLINIFEDEWDQHPDIVKDKIAYLLGKSTITERIGARKCHIRNISMEESNAFLDRNHVQGGASATYYYGAFYKDKLVAVMLFKRSGNNKAGDYELNRFATDNHIIVQGIASKMLKHFIMEQHPESIFSFADKRWTNPNSNVYERLGFKKVDETVPTYFYTTKLYPIERFHKFGFRKKILCHKYPEVCDMSMTEREMTDRLGYMRIYDCGLIKYQYKVNG